MPDPDPTPHEAAPLERSTGTGPLGEGDGAFDAGTSFDDSVASHEGSSFDDSGYWRANVRVLVVLLSIWFAASFGAGILLKDTLDRWTLPGTGFPLGFWFAQQGSIYVFVVLIFVYVVLMNRIDRRFGAHED
ncbi:MAG: DUF4212 domain-containing protein [Planctomycetota bacterium]